ncbi:tyrosine-protein kinase domain-containing protein [Nocardioides terrisoli]|uniref:polysaccharide biosynthesis tyrosine autokinase n=1 Tax=Nocardioides terrisoli TaxID=3388267 RepID=UPI00287B854E|nr:polysaccharide biosynthesis tyrosine autokinase [Nocardioides marmorisolisilvae]
MDFKEILRLARRRWKTVVSMVALALITAAAISFTATPIYHSTAKVFISTDVSNSSEAYFASVFSTQRVQSYADLATSGEVMQKVIDRLNLNMTPAELAQKISASVTTNTVIITLEVKDPNARTAQQIAQAEAEELTQYLADIETPAGKTTTPVKATITDKAQFDGTPISPKTGLNLGVAFLIGLLLGCALAVLRDFLDNTIGTPEDLAAVTDAPVMAHIAYDPSVPKSPLLTETATHAPRAETFRLLRTNLQFLDPDANPRSFVITSSVPSEGKTSTAVNLAIALAQAGSKVLLVDADLRRPRVAGMLGLESAVGVTTVLVGRSDLHSSIQRHQPSGLYFLASGPIPPNPTEILQSRATSDLLARLKAEFDTVVIDAPPLLPVADAAILATGADGAIMLVRHGKTTRDQLRHATGRLDQVGAKLFGVVVNMSPRRRGADYYGGYGYGYGYGYDVAAEKLAKTVETRS